MKKSFLPFTALFMALCLPAFAGGGMDVDPDVVPEVQYSRYVGLWYEIGHFPTPFQTECVRSTAEYKSIEEGKISVLNTCYREGKEPTSIQGTAFPPNRAEPAKLKVDFGFPRLGDYWVIDLDPEYRWAVVSGPGKKSLFILAREAPMAKPLLDGILQRLESKGFDTSRIIYDRYEP